MSAPPALRLGLLGLGAGALLLVTAPAWAWLPPALFVAISLVAPFFPALGFFHAVVSHGDRGRSEVALTFDDGPDPETTARLLDLLEDRGAAACFFVTGRAAAAHPELMRGIVDRGHEVGNHSYSHDPILMLRSAARLAREVDQATAVLDAQGIPTRYFRPPVGITNPRLGPILSKRGLTCVNFSRRAGDLGNRRIHGIAARILAGLRGGDIVLLHDRAPAPPGTTEEWLGEVAAILDGLETRGLDAVPLRRLLERDGEAEEC